MDGTTSEEQKPATDAASVAATPSPVGNFAWRAWLSRLRKPVLVAASVGTVLGGLAGYLNAYRAVRPSNVSAVAPPMSPPASAATLSIVVLPLANQTGDPTKAYIADGLTAAITSDLTRIADASIVPPLVAASLGSKALSLKQLADEAHVNFALQGGVQAAGTTLRIGIQLLDAQRQTALWSETIEGTAENLFALQDEVTVRVSTSVGSKMVLAAAADASKRPQSGAAADLLLRAAALMQKPQSLERLREIETLSRKALDAEPGNLRAKARLAQALWLQVDNFRTEAALDEATQRSMLREAKALATDVAAEDPGASGVRQALAYIAAREGDAASAAEWTAQFLKIDSRSIGAFTNAGLLAFHLGDLDAARRYTLRAIEMPSVFPSFDPMQNMALIELADGKADAALAWARKAQQADPKRGAIRLQLAVAYAMVGDVDRARSEATELLRQLPGMRARSLYEFGGERAWPGREAAYRESRARLVAAAKLAGLPE